MIKSTLKRILPASFIGWYQHREREASLSEAAKNLRASDHKGLKTQDIELQAAIDLAMAWMITAQQCSATHDGGVARHYSLNTGWAASYPETTGYIVSTFISLGKAENRSDYLECAERMLDWLVGIQMESGAFQGGVITHDPVPVTFNTGQILLGLASGAGHFSNEQYAKAMHKAAAWLRDTQDDDGCWRKFSTPFAESGDKTYETHVSWGLLEADRIAPGHGYGDAGLRQINWAMTKLTDNGWPEDCCLSNPEAPLSHTLGYALRGFVEGFRFAQDEKILRAAQNLGVGLLSAVDEEGYLPGRLTSSWDAAVPWVCLTGSVQIAASFFDLYSWDNDERWLVAAKSLNKYVRRTIVDSGDPGRVGAIAGSFPIDGDYGKWEYLNWAPKFFVDAQRLELALGD